MSWSRVLAFDDPFPYRMAFPNAEMEVFPTAKGTFRAEVTQIALNQLWMMRFQENLPRIQTAVTKRGCAGFGFLTKANQPELYSCGRLLSPGEIQVYDYELAHYKSGGDFSSGVIALPIGEFSAASVAIAGREFPDAPTRQFVRPSPALMERFLRQHEMVSQIAKTMPDLFAAAEAARALEQQLLHTLVECLNEGADLPTTAGIRRHELIVARFEDFLEANQKSPLYLAEVCAAIGATERTLRAACEEHLGMGPTRYLNLRRMHLVRRALTQAAHSTATVTQIVTDHGFWELGRFSVHYRAMFGEKPSETLRRPPDDSSIITKRPSYLARS